MLSEQKNPEQVELLAEETMDVLTAPPAWIITWGSAIVFSILTLVILGAGLVDYPDTITATVGITTENPPIPVAAKVSGRIDRLFVTDNQTVQKGAPLALLENTANFDDVMALKLKIESIARDFRLESCRSIWNMNQPGNYALGEIQSGYETLISLLKGYFFYDQHNIASNKQEIIVQKKAYLSSLISNLKEQMLLKENERDKIMFKYKINKELYDQGVITLLDLNQIEFECISKNTEIVSIKNSIIRSDIEINDLNSQLLELGNNQSVQNSDYGIQIKEALNVLYAQILSWEKNYLLTSPENGVVTLLKHWKENQLALVDEPLMKIIPGGKELMVKGTIPVEGAGKLKVGQAAIIKVDAYPFEEFGTLEGIVMAVSQAPQEDNFFVDIHLTDGLMSTYGKKLALKQEMKASAEIITKKRTLLRRMFEKLLAINSP